MEDFSDNEEFEYYSDLILEKKLELRDLQEQYDELQTSLEEISAKIDALQHEITHYESL